MSETLENDTDVLVENINPEPERVHESEPSLKISKPDLENNFKQLLKVGLEALKFTPPLYIQSIFGPITQWLPPYNEHSEFTIADVWRPLRTINFLKDVTVPAFSHAPKPWVRTLLPPLIRRCFWRPSDYFQQSDPFANNTSFSKEHWFFINGVATNEAVAQINSDLISKMFLRPVSVVHNATDSLLVDLVECAIGKEFETDPNLSEPQSMTEPTVKATVAVLKALVDPERDKVVVICHSQGTIITANVIRALKLALDKVRQNAPQSDTVTESADGTPNLLEKLAFDIICTHCVAIENTAVRDDYLASILKKLEVYTFANCANKMTYVTHTTDDNGNKVGLPFIENFANEFDLVARLGVLSPLKDDPEIIKIDGAVFEKQGKDSWGHLLNQHYLLAMDHHLRHPGSKEPYLAQSSQSGESASNGRPRLYEYFGGERPADYYR